MTYLLLLALVLVAGFVSFHLIQAIERRSVAQLFFGIGFILLGLGFLAQLILGFSFDEFAAKLFYWTRGSVTIAWLGLSLLLYLYPQRSFTRWLCWALIIASLAIFGFIFMTRITAAQHWYSVVHPIYGQIDDLLATNRPTRWGAFGLNVLGLGALMAGLVFFLRDRRSTVRWIAASLMVIGAFGLFVPIYWPPGEANFLFYLSELAIPVAMFLGLKTMSWQAPNTVPKGKST